MLSRCCFWLAGYDRGGPSMTYPFVSPVLAHPLLSWSLPLWSRCALSDVGAVCSVDVSPRRHIGACTGSQCLRGVVLVSLTGLRRSDSALRDSCLVWCSLHLWWSTWSLVVDYPIIQCARLEEICYDVAQTASRF